jgi:hypothetical protein
MDAVIGYIGPRSRLSAVPCFGTVSRADGFATRNPENATGAFQIGQETAVLGSSKTLQLGMALLIFMGYCLPLLPSRKLDKHC